MRAAALLLTLPVLCAAACSGSGEGARTEGGAEARTLPLALAQDPRSFDPADAGRAADMVVQRQVLESLLEYDPDAAPLGLRGLLAQSWEVSADGLEWRFTLREDARFRDPQEPPLWPGGSRAVEAADVVASWERLRDPALDADGSWAMEPIADFRAADERTVVVEMARPDPGFLHRIATPYFAVLPGDLEQTEGRSYRDTPVGSAPYLLEEWMPGQRAVLRRVPADDRARIERLKFDFVGDEATRDELFRRGEIARLSPAQSHARLLPGGELAPELAEAGVRLLRASIPDLTLLVFNLSDPALGVRPGDPEGNRQRLLLRRALAAAFPREDWARLVRPGGSAEPARVFLPPQLPEAEALDGFPWTGGAEQAAALLEEAGWPGGEGAPVIRYHTGGAGALDRALGDLFEASWEALGLEVEVVTMESFGALQEAAQRGEVGCMMRGWALEWPDAALIFELFDGALAGQYSNYSQFVNPGYDALLQEFRRTSEPARRAELARGLCEVLAREVPGVPVDHRGGYLLVQPWLLDFRLHPFDPYACKEWALAEDAP